MPYTPSYVPYLNRIRKIISQYNNGSLSNNKARMLIYEQVTKARDNGELLSRDLDILESSAYDLVEKLSNNPTTNSSLTPIFISITALIIIKVISWRVS